MPVAKLLFSQLKDHTAAGRCLCLLPALALLVSLHIAPAIAQDVVWEVGLTASRGLIQAQGFNAADQSAARILLLAGFNGADSWSGQAQLLADQYRSLDARSRPVHLIVIPVANPDSEDLVFPPVGEAYAEHPVAHALWRWIGVHAPDLVLIGGTDRGGFKQAAENYPLAGIGTIPVQVLNGESLTIDRLAAFERVAKSPAQREIARRLSRSPEELAYQLAETYGHDFSSPAYVPGMGLIGRMKLGFVDDAEDLLAPYLDGPAIEIDNPSLMAGQLVFAEHAELTRHPGSIERVVQAADLALDEQGNLREAMPFHSEMSDSVFMAPPLLAKAGKLTGNAQYFAMIGRHVGYMQALLLRNDGLYRHSPLADVPWSRGNAFPALGLALVLSDLPADHPEYAGLMDSYLDHLAALLPYQNADGLWRQVIDVPGSYPELSSTAMLGIAIKRGLDRGWLVAEHYQPALDAIWRAVLMRTSMSNEFVDVCTSTGKLQSLDAYLDRLAILGRDDRAGGMIMNLAIEMADALPATVPLN